MTKPKTIRRKKAWPKWAKWAAKDAFGDCHVFSELFPGWGDWHTQRVICGDLKIRGGWANSLRRIV